MRTNGLPMEPGALHDFKNLLTVITGHSELLLARLDASDPLWRSVNAIRKAAESGTALTSHLLAATRRTETADVVDLNAVVIAVAAMVEGAIGPAIELDVRCAPDAGRVRVARAEIEQVIVNLVVNARDAMPDGGRLTIETRPLTVAAGHARRVSDLPPGTWALLVVTDTGRGMEPAVAARLFEPYFTTKTGSGTGLGLATAKAIIRRHGGSIAVETAAGAGSAFRVALPTIAETPRMDTGAAAATPLEGSETVLLVEDEGELRELVREILELHGYRVLAARTADEAAATAARHAGPIQLVITDVFTPGMGPRELVPELRRRRPGIKVLYVSGHADEEIARRTGPFSGALLRKPFAVGALARKVREILDET